MKKLNYHINHDDLYLPGLEDLSTSVRYSCWLIYSCIKHFANSKQGYYDLYQAQWAKDLHVTQKTISKSIKILIDLDLIKLIRAYQRNGNIPARYSIVNQPSTNRYSTGSTKVWHGKPKGIAPETMVNKSSKKDLLKKNDNLNHSSLKRNVLDKIHEYTITQDWNDPNYMPPINDKNDNNFKF